MKKNTSDVMVRYAKFIDNYDPYLAYDANDTDMDDITFLATANTARAAYDHLEEILRDDTFDGQELETIHAIMDDLRIEVYRQALKADPTFFDDADIGYRPDDMVEGWGDIYLGKGIFLKELHGYEDATEDEIKAVFGDVFSLEDDSYYLADCRRDPSTYYKVER